MQLSSYCLIALGVTVGCSKATDADLIGDAQFCLDDLRTNGLSRDAIQPQVDRCLSGIKSLTSSQAYLLKCSGNFLIEGFGGVSKIETALNALQNSADEATLLNSLAFDNVTFAQQTSSVCQNSGSPSYTMLSSMASIATTMKDVLNVGNLNSTDITNLITSINSGDPDAQASAATIGNAAVATYEQSCTGGAVVDQALCNQFQSAVNSGGSSADI